MFIEFVRNLGYNKGVENYFAYLNYFYCIKAIKSRGLDLDDLGSKLNCPRKSFYFFKELDMFYRKRLEKLIRYAPPHYNCRCSSYLNLPQNLSLTDTQ